MSDSISRADAIEAVMAESRKVYTSEYANAERIIHEADAVEALAMLPSAEAVPQSEQYKKGFEDAKRAFELEYARESENMRKRNAQLEVMLNAQKAISAEAEWIPCSERLPSESGDYLVTLENGVVKILGYSTTQRTTYPKGFYHIEDGFSWRQIQNPVVAWMPLPTPYKGGDTE